MVEEFKTEQGDTVPNTKAKRRMPVISRDESLKRSAQMKAAIISLLNNSETPLSRSEISDRLNELATSLRYTANNFDNFIYTLSKNGLIKVVGKAPGIAGYMYASLKYNESQEDTQNRNMVVKRSSNLKKRKNVDDESHEHAGVEYQHARIRRVTENVAPVTVDIVKSTGRIRVSIGGISIDIGVVE